MSYKTFSLEEKVQRGFEVSGKFDLFLQAFKQLIIEGTLRSQELIDIPSGLSVKEEPDELDELKICIISYITPKHILKEYVHILPYGITRNLSSFYHDGMIDDFMKILDQALAQNPHFILINELAYPHPSFLKTRPEFFKIQNFLKEKIQEKLKNYKNCIYLIAGTYHDPSVYYNFSLIFHNDEEWEKNGTTMSPIFHAKRTSALKLGEKINVPATNQIRRYISRYGPFKVLVCLDIYNPLVTIPIIANAIKKPAQENNKFSIIFVPSYWPYGKALDKACKDLSLLTGAIVVYSDGADTQCNSGIAIAGEIIDKQNTPSGVEYKPLSRELECFVITKGYYKQKRRQWSISISDEFIDFIVRSSQKKVF